MYNDKPNRGGWRDSSYDNDREEGNGGRYQGGRRDYDSGSRGSQSGSRFGGSSFRRSGGDWNGRSESSSWTPGKYEPMQSFGSTPAQPAVEFKKNFYKPTTNVSANEAEEYRRSHDIKTIGDIPHPYIKFDQTPFDREILDTFRSRNFVSPTPIQAQGWPMALTGNDMVGIAQTGSGKTLSFVLPALIHAKDQIPLRNGDGPIVLVLAPTRELCMQIKDVFDEYRKYFNMRTTCVYGGVSSYNQKKDISMGCEIVIGCPGRLIDLNEQGILHFNRVTFMVLDEADRMLDMGFEPQLRKIITKTNPERQTLMWSATWPREVKKLAESYMTNFNHLTIGSEDLKTNVKIKQIVEIVDWKEKNGLLFDALREQKNEKVIIFANTKKMCDRLEDDLYQKGFKAIAIHGDKSQNIRDRIINDFRSGYKNILIATDVAARGLDIENVKLVINYDFPNNIEDYVHRIGRTARGNCKEGMSLSFFTNENRSCARELIKMLKDAKQDVNPKLNDMVGGSYSGGSRNYSNNRSFKSWY